ELGKLARPEEFFDFTRYRPTIYLEEGVRRVRLPNIEIRYAKRGEGSDLVFLHLLEPHMQGEAYVDSLLNLLGELGVVRYSVLGSMYDAVPHTKPLMVTGGALGEGAKRAIDWAGIRPSDYQGPTTIVFLLNQRAPELGMDSLWFIASLPHYVQLEEDHMGAVRLMEVLSSLYGLPVTEEEIAKAEEQRRNLDQILEVKPELKAVVAKLEEFYDERVSGGGAKPLSPEVERFLREISRDLGRE
ncbi:MAG: PAC2 family protein, partial [Candidatus Bipolaricaulia bacterium]